MASAELGHRAEKAVGYPPLSSRTTFSAGSSTKRSSRPAPFEDLLGMGQAAILKADRCRGGPFDLANFRRREWAPAIEASGVVRPARIYDLRSTFASNALAAGVSLLNWRVWWEPLWR